MMEYAEIVQLLRDSYKRLEKRQLSQVERLVIGTIKEHNYIYMGDCYRYKPQRPFHDVDDFLIQNNYFKTILPKNHQYLEIYFRHINEYSANTGLIRMDVRSDDFNDISIDRIMLVITAFYIYEAAELDIQDLIYGEYGNVLGPLFYDGGMAPVIAAHLLNDERDVEQYINDVLYDENNTAILSRHVIVAIEQSHNLALQDTLTNIFLNAKLQEGLRQSIVETADENNLDYFIRLLSVIDENNLIRYSSVQRAVMTWIGLGYEVAQDQKMAFLFKELKALYEDERLCLEYLHHDNPLLVYLGLAVTAARDLKAAIQYAAGLLESPQRHIVSAALIFLELTKHFDYLEHFDLLNQYAHDDLIEGLFIKNILAVDFREHRICKTDAIKTYDLLKTFAEHKKAKTVYKVKGFEWYSFNLEKSLIVSCMFQILRRFGDKAMLEEFLPYFASGHFIYSSEGIKHLESNYQRLDEDLIKGFAIKEIINTNRKLSDLCARILIGMRLKDEDIISLEERLKTKKGYARANIIEVLSKQSSGRVNQTYERLRASSSELIQESALELLDKTGDVIHAQSENKLNIIGRDRGYGLYKPQAAEQLPYPSFFKQYKKGWFKKTYHKDYSSIATLSKQQLMAYLKLWDERLKAHGEDEYECYGQIHKVNEHRFLGAYRHRMENLPLKEVWLAYFEQDKLSHTTIFEIMLNFRNDLFLNKIFDGNYGFFDFVDEDMKQFEYYSTFYNIFACLHEELRLQGAFRPLAAQYLEFFHTNAKYRGYKSTQDGRKIALSDSEIYQYLLRALNLEDADDDAFRLYFPLIYEGYIKYCLTLSHEITRKYKLDPIMLARAVSLRILDKQYLYECILDNQERQEFEERAYVCENQLTDAYRKAYFMNRGYYTLGKPNFALDQTYGPAQVILREVLDTIAEQLIGMEKERINAETELTPLIQNLYVLNGQNYLITAANVLKNEALNRDCYNRERNGEFSDVIRRSYPKEGDDINDLIQADIPTQRLIEIAMIAPQWIGTIEKVLGWPMFKEACYYFLAHNKEYNADNFDSDIALYTKLDVEDLKDGAFDIDWCKRVYAAIGEDRFKMMYDAAKFLAPNNFHTRVRKYTDAALGHKPKELFLQNVTDTRNKDSLNAYTLCPIENDADLLERYLNIQKFIKSSKQYGAQRQASEKRAAEIALINLANHSRFETATRLTWAMESKINENYARFFEDQEIEDIEARLRITANGDNEIVVSRGGKRLKSLPKKYLNRPEIIELKEVHKELNEQVRRSRRMLEQAMKDRTLFTEEEIALIAGNQIVAPMLSKLVLITDGHLGFYSDHQLKDLNGDRYGLDHGIRIAHPYDLYRSEDWAEYQKYIFANKLRQPFKQVFRELYLKLDEEKNGYQITRFRNYQFQTRKFLAALKSCKWNISNEGYIEKVLYQDDLVVDLYADFDWYTPSDIESPSIDAITFSTRREAKAVKIDDVDPTIFSEVMRDLDLAISVAYVGGVDPDTSYSTVELRANIIQLTCELMKLDNVCVEKNFAKIKGSLNTYYVNLKNAFIHQDGGAYINIVAVLSERRGHIYLPFLDEDPMTAEVLSKVVLLAEDDKIKDPGILEQIKRR